MNQLFNECDERGIAVYYSATDSILIDSFKVNLLQDHIGKGLGQLHIETAGQAVIARSGVYYLNDNHFRHCGVKHSTIESSGDIRRYYIDLLDE